ncbi:MAG: DUF2158 domain-containing protein [Pseudomonadota bacterium]
MRIETGQIVSLKSGGPAMTVCELGEHSDARCIWFSGQDLRNEWIPLAALRPARVTQNAPQAQPAPAPPQQRPVVPKG